jgi:hypothetical protein
MGKKLRAKKTIIGRVAISTIVFSTLTSGIEINNGERIEFSYIGKDTYYNILTQWDREEKYTIVAPDQVLQDERIWHLPDMSRDRAWSAIVECAKLDKYKITISEVDKMIKIINRKEKLIDPIYYVDKMGAVKRFESEQAKNAYIKSQGKLVEIDSAEAKKKRKQEIQDSIRLDTWDKITVRVIGYTENFAKKFGIGWPEKTIGLEIETKTGNRSSWFADLWLKISTVLEMQDRSDSLNFVRELEYVAIADTISQVRFATESRREQSITQSNGIVSTQYESVWDGLSVTVDKKIAKFDYRIAGTVVSASGRVGYPVIAQGETFTNETKRVPFGRHRKIYEGKNRQKLNMIMLVQTERI